MIPAAIRTTAAAYGVAVRLRLRQSRIGPQRSSSVSATAIIASDAVRRRHCSRLLARSSGEIVAVKRRWPAGVITSKDDAAGRVLAASKLSSIETGAIRLSKRNTSASVGRFALGGASERSAATV